MTKRELHFKSQFNGAIEQAILIVDEKQNIQQYSANITQYLKLPKTFNKLNQLDRVNKISIAAVAKKAINSFKRPGETNIYKDIKLKSYSLGIRIQKLIFKGNSQSLFSISILKNKLKAKPSATHISSKKGKNKFKISEGELNGELTLLIEENRRLKAENEKLHKYFEHYKTENDINLNELRNANFYANEMLKNVNVATLFLDFKLAIINYTPQVTKLFNIRKRDVGRKITSFTSVFINKEWQPFLQKVTKLNNAAEIELVTKNGQYYLVKISVTKFKTLKNKILSVSFTDISKQVKAQQSQIASEQKFRTLFESSADGMAIVDIDTGKIIASNKKMPQMLGLTKQAYLNSNPNNFIPKFQSDGTKSNELLKKLHNTFKEKGYASQIVEHKHKAKGNFFARLSEYKIPSSEQNYAAVVLQNVDKEIRAIEALKKRELELKESKDQYKNLYDNSIDGIGIFDLAKQEVVEINNSLVKMTGFSNEEYIARAPFGVFTENLADGSPTKDLYIQMVSHLVKGGKKSVGHFLHLHKTKAPFHVKISARKLPKPNEHIAVCVTRNIDIEKKAEAKSALHLLQLKASESMHKAFFNQSLDGHVILNMKDMMPVEVNKRLLKMFRISKTEYFQASPLDYFDAENNSFNVEEAFSNFRTSLEKNRPFEIEVYIKTKKRKSFLVKVLINQLSAPNQHLAYAVIKDIDKERKVEEAAKTHLKALISSESMHKAFFNQSMDGHIIINIKHMMPVETNKSFLKMLGISKTEYFNTNPSNFFDVENNTITEEQIFIDIRAHLKKNRPFEAEVYMKSRKRKSFLVKVLVNQLSTPNQHLVYAVIKDIDKEHKAEEATKANLKALTVSESMHKTFFNQSLDGHVILNAKDMMPVDINKRMLKILRISKAEFYNTKLYAFSDSIKNKITQAQFSNAIRASLKKNRPYEADMYLISRNRKPFLSKFLINQMPAPNEHLLYAVIKDIDKERKAKEEAKAHLKALTASESIFRTFFESGQDGFGIVQLFPKLKSIDINSRLSELHGLSKKEYFATKVLDLISPKQSNNKTAVELLEEIKQDLLKKGLYKGEVIYEHKKNGPFYASTKIVRLPAPDDDKIFIQVADKDKEVKALQQLAESESRFRTFFENGLDGFGIAQIFPKPKPIDVNPKMLELTGLSKKEFLNSKILDFMNPVQANNKSGKEVFDEITQSLIQKGFYRGEVIYKHKKNGPFYTNITMVRLKPPSDNEIFIQIANRDKEVKALQQVAKSEAMFKSIFANSLDGIVIYNIDIIEVVDCNERVLEMTNCTKQEFVNAHTKAFLPKKQPNGKASFPMFKQLLKNVSENKSINREWLFTRYKSDELVYAKISIVKLPQPFTKLAVLSIADITETKLAEQAVVEKSKAIQQANEQLKISLKKFNDTFSNAANYIARFNLEGRLIEHNETTYSNLLDKTVLTNNTKVWNLPRFSKHKAAQKQIRHDFALAKKGQQTKSRVPYTASPNFSGILEYTFKPLRNEKGDIFTILAEGYDVTKQVNVLKKLEFNEQKFRAIFSNSSNFIGIFNSKGIILDLNQTVKDNLNDKKTSSIGIAIWKFPWFLKHKNAQQKLKNAIEQAAQGEKAEGIMNYTIPNRLTGTMQFAITPIFNETGEVEWLLGEGKDISTIINAQRELSYKEQKFRAIFNNSSNLIGLYDTDGYVEEINQPQLKEVYKNEFPRKIKLWEGPRIANFKESQQTFKAGFKKALKGEIDRGIIEYAPLKNQVGIFEYTISPIFDENNKVIKILAEGKDITEKLQAQKQIEASEKRFKALFFNAENIVIRLSPKGRVIAHNKIVKSEKNYTKLKENIGKFLWNFSGVINNKISQEKLKKDIKQAANGKLVSGIVFSTKNKNQQIQLAYSFKPVFGIYNKKVEWILCEARDVTELIETQNQLLEKEQKFRAIFNNSSNFIGLYKLDGTIEEINKPIIEKIPKSKRTKINSKLKIWELPLSDSFKRAMKKTFKESLKKVLNGDVYIGTTQYSLNAKKDVCLEFIFSPVFDEYNNVFKVLGEARDITEQMNSRKQIEASEKRFKALFFNAENTVVRLSPKGRVIAHNHIKENKKNYDKVKKYIGKYLWELSGILNNKVSQKRLKQDIEIAANGKLTTGTIFSENSSQQQIQLAYSFKPIFGTNNKTVEWILGEAWDITEITKTQNQLLANEQKFRAIFYNSENYIARLDIRGNVLEHSRIHKDNPMYTLVKQYIDKPLWEFSGIAEHPKSISKLKKDIKACATGQFVSNQMEMRLYKLESNKNGVEYKTGLVVYSLTPVFNKNKAVDWILAEAKDITELDEAKNKLSFSLSKYQQLFENNLVGIVTLDENLKQVECNKAYEKITGYSFNEIKLTNYYDLIDKSEVKQAKLNEHRVKTSKVKSLQFKRTFLRKNGEKIVMNLYLKPVYVNNKFNSAIVTIADITELENKRKALKQSEELYKAVFEGVNDGLYVYNFKKHEIVTFNQQLLKIAGYRSEKKFLTRVTNQYIPFLKGKNKHNINWFKEINTQFKTQKTVKFDLRIEKDNRKHLDISTTSILLSDSLLLTAITDVTEIKKSEIALQESEIRYRSLFENNVTGIALGNKFGQILQVNKALCTMFGYSKNEMLQLKHQDLAMQGQDDQSYIHFKAMVEGRRKKFSTTKQFVKKNGDSFYAIFFVTGVYDRENNFKYNIASISDISELKNLEHELKKKQIELADKVVELEKYIESNLELENFAFIASHDLKSPTKTIINFSNLLINTAGNKLDKQEHQFLKFIVDGSNRLQNTINDLLNFSLANNNDLNIEKVNLKSLVKNVVKDLNSLITKYNAIINIENLPKHNWIDKGLIKQLFLNLITNAIKFQKKGTQPLIKIDCQKTPSGYVFSVKDNGIGIAKKSQHKIFGIFKRLHIYTEYEGTGIGLALCKKVVEKHQGKIWVESAKGKGSTFYFTLPKTFKTGS